MSDSTGNVHKRFLTKRACRVIEATTAILLVATMITWNSSGRPSPQMVGLANDMTVYSTDFEDVSKKDAGSLNMAIPNTFVFEGNGGAAMWMEGLDRVTPGIVPHSGSRCLGMELVDITKSRRNEFNIYDLKNLVGDELCVSVWLYLPVDWQLYGTSGAWNWYALVDPYFTAGPSYLPYGSIHLGQLPPSPNFAMTVDYRDLKGAQYTLNSYLDFPLPRGRWFQVQYYVLRSSTNGILKIWFDGTLVANHSGLQTKGPIEEWFTTVAKIYYNADNTFSPYRIWVDDLKISNAEPQVIMTTSTSSSTTATSTTSTSVLTSQFSTTSTMTTGTSTTYQTITSGTMTSAMTTPVTTIFTTTTPITSQTTTSSETSTLTTSVQPISTTTSSTSTSYTLTQSSGTSVTSSSTIPITSSTTTSSTSASHTTTSIFTSQQPTTTTTSTLSSASMTTSSSSTSITSSSMTTTSSFTTPTTTTSSTSNGNGKGTCRLVLDASPKTGLANKPVTISGTLYGSWNRIKDGVVVGNQVEISTSWGFRTTVTTDNHGRFSTSTNCPSMGGTYVITATSYEDQDLAGCFATITYQVSATTALTTTTVTTTPAITKTTTTQRIATTITIAKSGTTFYGRLTDAYGNPLGNKLLTIYYEDEGRMCSRSLVTDDNGNWSFSIGGVDSARITFAGDIHYLPCKAAYG